MATPGLEVPLNFLPLKGRRLAYAEYGPRDGVPVLYCHGFPGSHLDPVLVGFDRVAGVLGIRLIALDRPGMSLSTPQPGRRLLDWPQDAAALLDHLGLPRVRVLAYSGGGPYGLALAYALPERIEAITILAGMVPFQCPGAWEDLSMQVPRQWPLVRRLSAWALRLLANGNPERALSKVMASFPNRDRAFFMEPEVPERFLQGLRETFRTGTAGFLSDARIYREPWGFNLAKVKPGVLFWQGGLDINVDPGRERRLAAEVPESRFTLVEGEAHFSLAGYWGREILSELVSATA